MERTSPQLPRAATPARGRAPWIAAALAVAAVALAIATQFSIGRDAGVPDARTGFIVAVLLLFLAASTLARSPAGRPIEPPRWLEWRLLVVVLGVALLFRIHHFYSFPPGLWYDEAVNGTDAIDLMKHGNHLAVWRASNNGQPTMYFYLLIASFKLFGYTMLAMRMVPVIVGLAAVAAFYLLARQLLSPAAAIAATALLAVSRYAVTFSRISWAASLVPLFATLTVYFFVRAVDTRRWYHWAMAGATLAAGLYTYAGFRMVPIVMALLVLYVAVTRLRDVPRLLPGLVLYAVAFAIVVTPLAQFAIRHSDQVTARQGQVSIFDQPGDKDSGDLLRENVWADLKMMNVRGDPNARHNLPDAPMLDEISAALLVLGAGVAVWSIRDWRRGGLLLWYGLALVPSAVTLSYENPSAIRAIGVIPPMFLLIGLAIDELQRALSPGRLRRGAFAVAMVALVAWAAGINYHVLFEHQAKDQQVYDMFQSQLTRATRAVANEAGHSTVYFNDSFFGPQSDVLDRGKPFQSVQPVANVPVPAAARQGATFILDSNQEALEHYLVALYPDAQAEEVRDRWGRIDYIAVRIPASAVAGLHQARAEYGNPSGGAPTSVGEESRLTHAWPKERPEGFGYPFTLSWSGLIRLNPQVDQKLLQVAMPAPTLIELSSPGPVHLEIEGVGARDGNGSAVVDIPPDVVAGLYRFRATALVTGDGVTQLQWQLGPGVRQVVPPDALVLDAPVANGFLARHYQGSEWSGPVLFRSLEPVAIPAPRLQPKYSVAMDGLLDVTQPGDYAFAVNAEWPVSVAVDGRTVVEYAASTHGWNRFDGVVTLDAGRHVVTLKYASVGRTSFRVEWKPPGEDWRNFTGQEVTHPPLSSVGG